MIDDDYEIPGEELKGIDGLTSKFAVRTCSALLERDDFNLARLIHAGKDRPADILIVECIHDGIPNKNPVGIKGREKLALVFPIDEEKQPEVLALRKSFPVIIHENATATDSPSSLCLYAEPWSHIRRGWTPQQHLDRIKWWLLSSAAETIHADDQPVEQLFFKPRLEIVIPSNFPEGLQDSNKFFNILPAPRNPYSKDFNILIGSFDASPKFIWVCLPISLPPIVHGLIEKTPRTLGELHDQLQQRGANFHELLVEAAKKRVTSSGIAASTEKLTLILINIPILRNHGDTDYERVDQIGYAAITPFTEIGVNLGALFKAPDDDIYYADTGIPSAESPTSEAWKDIKVDQLGIIHEFNSELAQIYSGITAGPINVVLAGYGALGSAIHMLWLRNGWGKKWTIIDDDYLKPHNLTRHTALSKCIGMNKVAWAEAATQLMLPGSEVACKPILDQANNLRNGNLVGALGEADLVIDMTTTLEVPRDLANQDDVGRSCSLFLTPTGNGSALLIEDTDRTTRLDALEAQYYRAVIDSPWGESHLAPPKDRYITGSRCRDISNKLSNEYVSMHAAALSIRLRSAYQGNAASIHVLNHEEESGSLNAVNILPAAPLSVKKDTYTLYWDEHIRQKVRQLRLDRLPNETGGILLGYFDNVLNKIFVVDALPAPTDSKEEPSGFERGKDGVLDSVKEARIKSGGVVTYIGEWHSHPPGVGTNLSPLDVFLLTSLATQLNHDGFPALMLIVGDEKETWHMLSKLSELPDER